MIIDSPIVSGSASASGSLNQHGDIVITGSLTVTGPITGALTGSVDSASFASTAISSSYAASATSASYAISATSSSYANDATSASYAVNTSFLNGSGSGEFTPTGSFNAFSSSILTYTGSNNTNISNIHSTTASLNTASGSAITRLSSIESTTGSLNAASGSAITRLNALEVTSGSNITRISALEVASGSAQSQLTSLQAQTGSYATTGSNTFIGTQTITGSVLQSGSLSVNGCITSTGQIVAQTINVQQVTSSIVYSCGDNIFGTALTNTQTLCGNVFNTGSLACFAGRICSNTLSTAGAVNLGGALTGTSATFSSAMKSNGVEITNTANSDILDIFQSPSVLNSFIDYPASRNLIIRNKGTLCGLTIESTGAATFNGGGVIIKSGNGDQLLLNNSGDRFTQINFSNNNVSKANIWWDNTNTELVLLASGSGTGHLKIANTGAATFSSSVNVGGASTTNDLNIYNTTNAGITLQSSFTGTTGNDGFYIGQSFQSTNFLFRNRENADIIFETNNGSERMRISSGGSINFSATDAATQYYFGANRPDATTLFVNGTNNNKIRIQNAETDIVVINSNGASYFNGGNVLIKTTTDNGTDALQVAGSGRFTSSVNVNGNTSTYPLAVKLDTNKNIGFRLNTEAEIVAINDALDGTVPLKINSSTLAVTGAATFSSSVTANSLVIKNSGVPAAQLFRDLDVISVGSAGQGIEFGARNGSTLTAGAAIYGGLDNPATTGTLVFQTMCNSSLSTKMTITSCGNVSIGVSDPDIFARGDARNVGIGASGASDNLALQLNAGGSGGRGAQIYMGQGGTRHFTISSNVTESTIGTTSNTPLRFVTCDSLERLRIFNTGITCFACQVCASSFNAPTVNIGTSLSGYALTVKEKGCTGAPFMAFIGDSSNGSWMRSYWFCSDTTTTLAQLTVQPTDNMYFGSLVAMPLILQTNNSNRVTIASTGAACFACELTAKSLGTNDLILNNLNHEYPNYVDGTRGSWLIQEGACDLFIINQVSCKKYKFNLIEIK
jgi:hypothetical protein